LTKQCDAEYKKHKGIDLLTKNRVIEIEVTKNGIYQGIDKVKRSSKARYFVVNDRNIQNVLEGTSGT